MTPVSLIAELEALGVLLWAEAGELRFRAPAGTLTEARKALLREHKAALVAHLTEAEAMRVDADPAGRHAPFPLTDVQAAYLVGRGEAYDYGGVGCHGYVELDLDDDLDPARVERAWHRVIGRHEMLRAVVSPSGSQRVLEDVVPPPLVVDDLRGRAAAEVDAARNLTRDTLATRRYTPDAWPLYELRLSRADSGSRLHLSLDLLIADFVSIRIMLEELDRFIREPDAALPLPGATFRDVLLAERRMRDLPSRRARRDRDRDYWLARLPALPLAPELPTIERSESAPASFRRHALTLPPARWAALRTLAGEHRVTPSGAILAAFAQTVDRWSRQPAFCLNVTVLNRPPLHPDVDRIVGDFTSVNVLEVRAEDGERFDERARALQQRLWDDLEHSTFTGIDVLRELAREHARRDLIMPVVFTSTLGIDGATDDASGEFMRGARLGYGITQTPQVWLDCQVAERGGALYLNWDVRDGVFAPGTIDDAFASFASLLDRLADDAAAWDAADPLELPPATRACRARVNDTAAPLPDGLLYDGFVDRACRQPDAPAVIDVRGTTSYGALYAQAVALADALRAGGCAPGECVAIAMDKSAAQIAAAIGVQLAGAAYLPLDPHQPAARRDTILADARVRAVLTDAAHREAGWPDGIAVLDACALAACAGDTATDTAPTRVAPDRLAYVIYTSGTTGVPKGVMMSHAATLNTIVDLNARFAVGERDRVFGLASLAFDLSVYDIFGTLAAGAALVLPEPARRGDPSHWATLANAHAVTIWNSVPAQMQMLVSHLDSEPDAAPRALRLAMLSGDWIPVGLPAAIRAHCPDLRVASLGGATEAAIWSIWHDVVDVPADARGIPYGTPLVNQTFHVLDARMRSCPNGVPGELHIGGAGLALGYLHDPERTAARFVDASRAGLGRLYRTGDLGRYRADGVIEFLGREDSQVKIRGHRIELGEIEAALQSYPGVAAAAAVACGDGPAERRLAVYVEAQACAPVDGRDAGRRIAAAARTAGDASVATLDRPALVRWIETADDVARHDMLAALRTAGLFADTQGVHDLDAIVARTGTAPEHRRLMRRWLRSLQDAGWIERAGTGGDGWTLRREPAPDEAARDWATLQQLESQIHYSAELLRYLRDSGAHLGGLLRSEVDPLDLLFPQGKLDTAVAAYNDNLVNRCMNAVVCAAAREIARDATPAASARRPLRVLEIGAGVGGTSRALIPALADVPVDYLYSDVSPFFLNEARERHADTPWVRYGLFDLNHDYVAQGLTAGSWDVIVCSNVLHNAKHAPTVIDRLRELGAPGCTLIVIEATREIAALMTSMEFQSGLSGFVDERDALDQTFFTREQWQRMFDAAGGELLAAYPDAGDPLARVGQVAFVVRFPQQHAVLRETALVDHLRERVPAAMLPSRIEVLRALPLTRNGKVDRAALSARAVAAGRPGAAATVAERPRDELEARIAALWETALGRSGLGRDEDFFRAGGDSLLIAQVVARMREHLVEARDWEWDRLMREILRAPTVAGAAAALGRRMTSGSAAAGPGDEAARLSPLVVLAPARRPGERIHVVLHDGSGTLAPYRALLPLLADAPERVGEIVGITVPDATAYLARDPAELIASLALEYADLLLARGARRVHLIGYCMGGLLANELGRVLLERGAALDPVTVISSDRFRFRIDDELLLERAFGGLLGADIAAAGHAVDDIQLERALLAVRERHGEHLPAGCLAALNGEHGAVGDCYARLARQPAGERLAALAKTVSSRAWEVTPDQVGALFRVFRHSLDAVARYRPEPFTGDLHLLQDDEALHFLPGLQPDMRSFWTAIALGGLDIEQIAGNHLSCLQPPHVGAVASRILLREAA
ncbi:non-ribosomal peptide synthetase [Burkholderia anthina]|uniref:L-cysteine--[L-cysteinyl-carrier protein] ligase n=1 Tax=Burkholderia anthina TaxID=179879 RepID=A0A6P2G6D3_9BURK|nr:non-ribosomal peptide synthetase [Burkholderia anthina]MBM2766525.1 amino acid adenylation domain-containing protein [Burkholderia anthina]VVU48896.1 non-ribosomal peptide synthetase [Burkholderia anthina]